MENLLTSKMPSSSEANGVSAQTEKPHHYTYLKEFRTQQCPLFLQHKCTQHRPFTCFHWHFMNQRRRRPIRKKDTTFGYSPDVYCTKYDETTGICPEGDDCPLLHRTAGDTERRYHLRYYKTSVCVHETDARGHCVKNGPHCAFAHGAHDLRPPIYDPRELQTLEGTFPQAVLGESPLGSSFEKDRTVNDDPQWNDTNYVLANYKTESCKRPPRLCRQGYACPSFHNTRDKRRSPKKIKYRSTPCPNVKHGDDWGDPSGCENGENCPYCHTRTEQQFHPEIYKSTKCNDMVQTGYCPRGPFCAFAHVEQEMTVQRDMASPSENSLAAFVTSVLPPSKSDFDKDEKKGSSEVRGGEKDLEKNNNQQEQQNKQDVIETDIGSFGQNGGSVVLSNSMSSMEQRKFRHLSGSSNTSTDSLPHANGMHYQKAPGSEREDPQIKLRQQMQAIDTDTMLDIAEKTKRKQNLLQLHNHNLSQVCMSSSFFPPLGASPAGSCSTMSSTMSPHAPSFYPAVDTVESVIGIALDEDLNLGELTLSSAEDLTRDNDNETNSVCSSLGTGFSSSAGYMGAKSVPVTIPSSNYQRGSIGSLSQSPCSPIGSGPITFQQQRQEQQLHDAAAAFLSQPNPGKYSAPGVASEFGNGMSPQSGSMSQSPMMSSSAGNFGGSTADIQRLREELVTYKTRLQQWEDGITQARNACEAWKREAEDCSKRTKSMEDEKLLAVKQRDEALYELSQTKMELEQLRGINAFFQLPARSQTDPASISRSQQALATDAAKTAQPNLKQMQSQLRFQLDAIDEVLFKQTFPYDLPGVGPNGDSHPLPKNKLPM